jgi:hypothetical protein
MENESIAIFGQISFTKKNIHKKYVKSEKVQDSQNHKTYKMKLEGSNYGRDKN